MLTFESAMRPGLVATVIWLAASAASAQVPETALSCDHPELWLSELSVPDVPAAYCRACSDRCTDGAMRWRLLSGTQGIGCRELEYAALAIGAVLGERVTDPEWRAYFEAQPWHRPRRPEWTPVARENQRWLEGEARTCAAREPPTDLRVRRRVARWLDGLRRGRPSVPSTVYLNGDRSARAEVRAALIERYVPPFTARASVRLVLVVDGVGGPRTYDVDTTNGIGCVETVDEMCDSTPIQLTFDSQGRLIALHVTLAG